MKSLIKIFKTSLALVLSATLAGTLLVAIQTTSDSSGFLKTSTVAEAAGLAYEDNLGHSTNLPSATGCIGGGCNTSNPGGSGGGVYDPTFKTIYYTCTSVDAGGTCHINRMLNQDRAVARVLNCSSMRLYVDGQQVATTGTGAVNYMRNKIGGIWNGANDEEKMFSHLTGRDLGWAPYPVAWSEISKERYKTAGAKKIGKFNWKCYNGLRVEAVSLTNDRNATCAPKRDGRPFPYAVGISQTYKNHNTQKIFYGTNQSWQNSDWGPYGNGRCIYVNTATPPPKVKDVMQTCYWGLNHDGYYSTNRASIKSGGAKTTNKPSFPNNNARQPSLTGSGKTAKVNNCTQTISMDAQLSLTDGYAYYRLQGNAKYQKYQYYIWDTRYTRGQRILAEIRPAGAGTESKVAYGANSCSNNPPFRQYGSFNQLPGQGTIVFDYSDCPQIRDRWECDINGAPQINNVSNNVQVMRDGVFIPLRLPSVTITGDAVRDSGNKVRGTISGNNMSYRTNVVSGSSPFLGTNQNASKQYFELFNNSNKEEGFGAWRKDPNGNTSKKLSYYWSSDNGKNWKMTYEARIDRAEFLVPWQNTAGGPVTERWVEDTSIICDTMRTSNAASVVRSAGSE